MVLRELVQITVALSLTLGLFGLPGWDPDVCMVNKVGGEEGQRPWSFGSHWPNTANPALWLLDLKELVMLMGNTCI